MRMLAGSVLGCVAMAVLIARRCAWLQRAAVTADALIERNAANRRRCCQGMDRIDESLRDRTAARRQEQHHALNALRRRFTGYTDDKRRFQRVS